MKKLVPTKFTIITSTFNAGEALEATARSLRQQSYPHFEWIIVDGASSDGTLDVARRNGDIVSVLVSEPDSGIYDAWNKALSHVRGNWVLFLGAGDELNSPGSLAEIAGFLADVPPGATLCYGSVNEVNESGQVLRLRDETWMGLDGPWTTGRPVLPCHQGVLHKATLFASGFRFDTRCRIASDSEIMLRELISGNGIKLPITVTHFLWGGVSSIRANRLRMIAEIIFINLKLGIFLHRPFYQAKLLAMNLALHPLRALGLGSR